ncbi:MAG: HEAT repeat domain-containing protein [Polyangiales bacterium]
MSRTPSLIAAATLAALCSAGDWPGAGDALVNEYASAPPARRVALVTEAASVQGRAMNAVLALALRDASEPVVVAALEAITRHRIESAAPQVVQCLADERVGVRLAAVDAARAIRAAGALGGLTRAAGDSDVSVRARAVAAIAALAVEGSADALLDRVHDPESVVRVAAVEALGDLADPRAVLSILGVLDDPNPDVRGTAARALGAMRDPRAVRALRGALGDEVPAVVLAAVRALGALGVDARDAVDDLAPLALRATPRTDLAAASALARAAIESLAAIGTSEAASLLARVARRGRDDDLAVLADAAGRAPREHAERVLQAVLPLESPTTAQIHLLGALGGPPAADAILAWLEQGPSPGVLAQGLEALGRTGDPRAARVLLRFGTTAAPAPPARGAGPCRQTNEFRGALSGLRTLELREGRLPELALDPLLAMVRIPTVSCAEPLAELVALVGATENVRAAGVLLEWTRSSDARIGLAAMRALVRTGGFSLDAMLSRLGDPSDEVRLAAGDAIARHARRGRAARRREALGARAPRPGDRRARAGQFPKRDRIGNSSTAMRNFMAALPSLRALLAEGDAQSAEAAVDALARIAAAGSGAAVEAIRRGVTARPTLRAAAVSALGDALAAARGDTRAALTRALAELADDGPAGVWALRGDPAADDAIVSALVGPHSATATNAAAALAWRAREPGGALPDPAGLCARWRGARDPWVRSNLGMALVSAGALCAAEVMREASRPDAPGYARRAVASAAGGRTDDAAARRFLDNCAMRDASPGVARHCAALLRRGASAREDLDALVVDPNATGARGAALRLTLADGLVLRVTPGAGGWIRVGSVAAGGFSVER